MTPAGVKRVLASGRTNHNREIMETVLNSDYLLQFFTYAHLPSELQTVSIPFSNLAYSIVSILPSNAERDMALRKLLEAKDCAVRAKVFKVI